MKPSNLICGIITACLFLNTNAQVERFPDFKSLIGSWKTETGKGLLFENWQKVDDSSFRSQSYRVSGGDTVYLESADLVIRNEKLMYIPTVPDQNSHMPVLFVAIRFKGDTCVFENKDHDFPQRIIYIVPSGYKMHAWIEGVVNGKWKRIDYFYTKASN